mgnify:CR=1 FL=1
MHDHALEDWRHDHVFLGADHARNERRTWMVIALTATMMVGEIAAGLALAYVAAQVAGGIAGAILAHAMFDLPLIQASTTVRTGGPQWLAEGVATFGLVAVILGGLRARAEAVPWLVGLYITAAYWFTASTSFANPAVAIARGFTDTFSGIRPVDVPAFVVAQCAGAVVAALVMGWLYRRAGAPLRH